MSLEQKDLELIESIIYKNSDDIAVSIARSFERLEERVNDVETRLYSRLSEVEDSVESTSQDIVGSIREFRDEIRDLVRMRDEAELD